MGHPFPILETVQNELISEALQSPQMLADIAGLEKYVAESYATRAFIELLQNADDASSKEVVFIHGDGWVICANSGRPFTLSDFRSLCRSASSEKSRGSGIGYRGIGFKSVAGIAKVIHLISNNVSATFSKELTRERIGGDLPVPLIRIPHQLSIDRDAPPFASAKKLVSLGFETAFILEGLNQDQVGEEFSRFDSDYLIFLHHIESVVLDNGPRSEYRCIRTSSTNAGTRVVATGPNGQESWQVEHRNSVSIAFSMNGETPSPLKENDSLVHAFLPTLESTGIGVRINGDFSTDPSRTRIIIDEESEKHIADAAQLACDLVVWAIENPTEGSTAILACLAPNIDEVALQFQKRGFRTVFLSEFATRLKIAREKLALAPSWLNSSDAVAIGSDPDGRRVVPSPGAAPDDPTSRIAKFAGAPTVDVAHIIDSASVGTISDTGVADLIDFVMKAPIPVGITLAGTTEAKIWPSVNGRTSLRETCESGFVLSDSFLSDLAKRGLDSSALFRSLARYVVDAGALSHALSITVETGVPNRSDQNALSPTTAAVSTVTDPLGNGHQPPRSNAPQSSTPRVLTSGNNSAWRSAELLVMDLLIKLGYDAEDHSRRNLGYDVFVSAPGVTYHVEVKSINYPGQPFALTPNEESFCRHSAGTYIVALVFREDAATHVQFIRNPNSSLHFTKQCRQWAWECHDYKFEPEYEIAH